MRTVAAALLAASVALLSTALPPGAGAQEENRLRPDERLRPAPTDRPAGRGGGPARDPSIDDARAVEQGDLATRCRPPGAPTGADGGAGLPAPAKAEADAQGECVLPPTGQPMGQKALDKLSEPKR